MELGVQRDLNTPATKLKIRHRTASLSPCSSEFGKTLPDQITQSLELEFIGATLSRTQVTLQISQFLYVT